MTPLTRNHKTIHPQDPQPVLELNDLMRMKQAQRSGGRSRSRGKQQQRRENEGKRNEACTIDGWTEGWTDDLCPATQLPLSLPSRRFMVCVPAGVHRGRGAASSFALRRPSQRRKWVVSGRGGPS